MHKLSLVLLSAAALAASAAEFYRLDLLTLPVDGVFVRTDENGKPDAMREQWNMWPQTPGAVAASIEEVDDVKAIEVKKGFLLTTNGWRMNDAVRKSVVYAAFRVMVTEQKPGIAGTLALLQKNGCAGPCIALNNKDGVLKVRACNGAGDGKVQWRDIADAGFGQWIDIGVRMDFAARTYDVTVNGVTVEGNNFRHASAWIGELWPSARNNWSYRFDLKAEKTDVLLSGLVFSTEPIKTEPSPGN